MFRFPSTTNIQEVTGTTKAIVEKVLTTCEEGFGWQWIEATKQLEFFTGGVIPDVIIPNVVGKLLNFKCFSI